MKRISSKTNGVAYKKAILFILSLILLSVSAQRISAGMNANNGVQPTGDNHIFDFSYTGKEEIFTVPQTGLYTIEAWGAQGGSRGEGIGGKGGFTSGDIYLEKGEELYIYVGGAGDEIGQGFNGGGTAYHTGQKTYGGGATDVRVVGRSEYNRILVAAGGGSSSISHNGGAGGGINGEDGSGTDGYRAQGASQTDSNGNRRGGFGYGGDGLIRSSNNNGGGAGGGGWYGGGGAYEYYNSHYSGAGGSSYILTATSYRPKDYNPLSKYYFKNAMLVSGKESFFDKDGKRTTGNEDNGHFRIKLNSEVDQGNANLNDIKINGVSLAGFREDKYEYTVSLAGEYIATDEVTVEKKHTNQIIDGDGKVSFTHGNKKHIIRVYSEDQKNQKDYVINFERKPSSKLYNLDFSGYKFEDGKEFKYNVTDYSLNIFQYEKLRANLTTFDDNATVTILGLNNIKKGNNLVQVKVKAEDGNETIYNISVYSDYSINFDFKKREQVFVVPYSGLYKFEVWGAQGGSRNDNVEGGLGGFSSGEVYLTKGEEIYLYTGGQGNELSEGFNGGGTSAHSGIATYGGGGSDIRVGGNGVYNRIIVAGGGGASSVSQNGGLAGGSNGEDGSGTDGYRALGATQTGSNGNRMGGFGYGGNGLIRNSNNNGGGGGGGGWFGGGGAYEYYNSHHSGAGGSGYIYTKTSYKPAGYNPDEKYLMTNVSDGSIGDKDLNTWQQSFIDVDGKRVSGHAGDGHIRLTYYSDEMKSSANLQGIRINDIEIPNFDPTVLEYTVSLDPDYVGIDEIVVTKTLGNQVVTGTGRQEFTKGNFTHPITVISADGKHNQTYYIHFVRGNTSKLFNLEVEGFLYKDEVAFRDDVFEYEVNTFQDDEITINYETYNENSKVTIFGLDNLDKPRNEVQVLVETPNVEDQTYIIYINRNNAIDYNFKKREQVFVVPYSGLYKFEVWGAQGGSRNDNVEGGLGGFSSGEVYLTKGEEIYLYTGGQGNELSEGFNGGGTSAHSGIATYGGGGSDIRVGGNGVYNRIIVAGGGGASSVSQNGGLAGGSKGEDGSGTDGYRALGATQTGSNGNRMGGFGYGGNGLIRSSNNNGGGGGGGGWFGGGGAYEYYNSHHSGAGGSGYIYSKDSHKPNGYNPDEKYLMTNVSDGSIGDKDLNTWQQSFIDVDGKRVNGHAGDGHIRVTYFSDSTKSSTKLNDIKINGQSIVNFDPEQRNYTIEIDGEYTKDQEIIVDKVHSGQNIIGTGVIKLSHHNYSHSIKVRSADKSLEEVYTINYVRKPSSKLADLSVDQYVHAFSENYRYDKYSYDLKSYVYGAVEVKYTTFDQNATVSVEGAREEELRPGNNKIIVTVSSEGVQDTIYEINAYRQRDIEFEYTGEIQEFNIPYTGIYKFELWGAQGGSRGEAKGGKGGYTSAEVFLKKGEKAYINVGGLGDEINQGYNGGGKSAHNGPETYGGGATDIRFGGHGIYNRVIVAGGGGASSTVNDGGFGGGLDSGDGSGTGSYQALGAGQSNVTGGRRGSFGYGGNGILRSSNNNGGGGGGGGWFGGGGAYEYYNEFYSGAGGSGYVYTNSSHKPDSYSPSSKYYMSNPILINGESEMPGREGHTVYGNENNGFARVALMNLYGTDSTLEYLNFSHGNLNQAFDPKILDYDLVLDPDQTQLTISADTTDHNAFVAWDSEKVLTIKPGITNFDFLVTAQDGSTTVYTVRVHRSPSANSYLNSLSLNGNVIENFSPEKLDYEINLGYDASRDMEVSWEESRPLQVITGSKSHILENNKSITIVVISEDGKNTSEYTITPKIEDSNLLKSVVIEEVDFQFEQDVFTYDLIVPSSISSLNITAIPYDHEAVVSIVGNGYLRNGENKIEIIVDEPYTETLVYTINVTRSDLESGNVDKEYDYIYSGGVEYFQAPHTGKFKLEAWGAEGGNRNKSSGGKGGYSKGVVHLRKDEIIAVYVGGAGNSVQQGFNGGGKSATEGVFGGGASDVRVNGFSLQERILVAGGGGSVGAANKPGAAGGGFEGISNRYNYGSGGQGGSQTAAGYQGDFGVGGNGNYRNNGRGGAGGGGWYGGGGVNPDYSGDDDRGGGGGSGYVLTDQSYKPQDYMVDSQYYMTDVQCIGGNMQITNKDGGFVEGNSGNGFVRITALRRASDDNHLAKIELNNGASLEPVFELDTYNYEVNLDVNHTELLVRAIPMDQRASIVGNGTYSIPKEGKVIELFVTSESGELRTYTIKVNREASSNSVPQDIVITGLSPSLCNVSNDYCNLKPQFTPGDVGGTYSMIVPGRIRSIEFSVIKGHAYQSVIGLSNEDNGIVELEPGDNNEVYIEVGSEDGQSYSHYTFLISRDMTGNADMDYINITYPDRNLEFNTEITEYYISVPNEIAHTDDIDWAFAPMDPLANVVISNEGDLKLGSNEVIFTVVANNGQSKDYRLYIYREHSANTFLDKLIVTHSETALLISPSFNKTINDYMLTVENEIDYIDVIATAEAQQTIVVNGEDGHYDLSVGKNEIIISTTAEDGTVGFYNLLVVRKPSNNSSIKELKIDGEIVANFDPNKLVQTINVDSQVTNPSLDVILDSEFATYEISGKHSKFGVGENTVYIRVAAEDGSITSYTLIFNKAVSENSGLALIESNLFTITDRFEESVTSYEITIPYTETLLTLKGKPSHKTSTVEGNGGYYLKSGKNELKLVVRAEGMSTTTYTLNVNMLSNTDAKMQELTTNVGVFDPGFNPNLVEYNINVPNENSVIKISGSPSISSTKVEGLGEYALNTGLNIIEINTTAESGRKMKYTLNITRDVSSNADLSYLVVHEGALSRDFLPGVIEYDVIVPFGTRRLTIEAAVANPFAEYRILNASDLKPGHNTVIVRVSPQDQVGVKDYVLNVYVQSEASENINLSKLETSQGMMQPNFLPRRQFYRVAVGNEVEDLNITAKADANVKVVGSGNHKLKVGRNLIVVRTQAANNITKDYQIEVDRAPSSEARLKTMSVGGLTNSLYFRPDNFAYRGSTHLTELKIAATTIHPEATYEIIGNHDFVTNSKVNVIVRVTAEDGITIQDYVIDVRKYASQNNNLESLTVSGVHFTPNFNPAQTTYTAHVDESITQVIVDAKAQDPNAKVENDRNYTLVMGANFIDIKVVSENNKVRKYTIVINKEGSKVRDLDNLLINGVSVEGFDKDKLEYSYEVDYSEDSIEIDYSLVDPRSSVTGAGKVDLQVGNNIIPIIVTSENGNTKTYNLNVWRKEVNSAKIESLSIDNYPLENKFSPSRHFYNVVIDNEFERLRFNFKLEDQKATVLIKGNENLQEGNNKVVIEVTSSQKDQTLEYEFNVYRQKYGNNTLAYLETDKGQLQPEFFGGEMVYKVDLSYEEDNITLFGETLVASAKVEGLKTYGLDYGINQIKVPVTADNGVSRTYHVFANRSLSNDNYLNSLIVEANGKDYQLTQNFDPKINEYTLANDLPAGVDYVNFITTSNATKVVGNGQQSIKVGKNKMEITVTSESGISNTYIININRTASTNNRLVNITPSAGGLAPNFIYSENKYKLNVDTATTSLEFFVNTEDANAKVSGHERQIVDVGVSERVIKVTAENGDVYEYFIEVTKNDTNNAKLDNLGVNDFEISPKFADDIYSYDLIVPNSKNIIRQNEIIFKTQDKNATVEFSGSLNLLTGDIPNVYEVRVTAVDGFTSQTYRINIIRESSSEAVIEQITFNKGELNKAFNSHVYTYDLEFSSKDSLFNKNNITSLITSEEKTIVSYSHNEDILLEAGKVVPFVITVTSEDKTNVKKYTFNITYTRSKDNRLAAIDLEGGHFNPAFDPDIFDYEVNVHEDTRSIILKAYNRDPKAKITKIENSKDLINFSTILEIKVAAENGDEAVYKLNVKRSLSSRVDLKNIQLTDAQGSTLNPKFNNIHTQYEAVVYRDNSHVGLIVEKGHQSQKLVLYDKFNNVLDLNKFDLSIGRNEFKLVVKSPYDDQREINILIIRDGNNNTNLDSLTVTNPSIDIDFMPDKLEYFINVANAFEEIVIDYQAAVDTSKVSVLNNTNLSVGNNDVVVRVTAENGDIKDYIIHVFRESEYNNYLSGITVSVGGKVEINGSESFTPKFNKGIFSYKVEVPSTTTKVSVQGVPSNVQTQVTGSALSQTDKFLENGVELNLLPGNNPVRLMSELDGHIMIYTVNIVKKMSDDVTLETLEVFEGLDLLEFEEGTYNPEINFYTTTVGPDTDSVTVTTTQANKNARVEIKGNKNLFRGENLVQVIVTSEDRTKQKVYNIVVKKELSSDTSLTSLSIRHGENPSHDFDLSQDNASHQYRVTKDVAAVVVDATSNDPLAHINGVGTHSLAYGNNEITVSIKAQNGAVFNHTITVFREYDNSLQSLRVNQGLLDPNFDPEIKEYTVWVPVTVEKINIEGIAANSPTAKVAGNGWYNLNIGSNNNFEISVSSSAEDTPAVTKVKVIRSASTNTKLSLLEVDQGLLSPTFTSTINEYVTYIQDTNTSVDLTVVPEDTKATFEIVNFENVTIDRNDKSRVKLSQITAEETEVIIRVIAENGDSQDTKLTIYRQPPSLFSNKLKTLDVSPIERISPAFNPNTNNYVANVGEETTFITIKATTASSDARIVSGTGSFPVKPGRNVYEVVVKSKDGIDNVYRVIINQNPSSDATLKELSFAEGYITPIFSKGREKYSLNVNASTNFLTPTIVPSANGTTWTISGGGFDKDLVMGENLVVIETLAADGKSVKRYEVVVNKTNETSVNLSSLTSNLGVFDKEFNKFLTDYTLTIGADVNSVILEAKAEEPQSVSAIEGIGVIDMSGVNNKIVEITVRGKADNFKVYTVNIVKAIDTNVILTYLSVLPGSLEPSFNQNQTMYNVTLASDVEQIEILANANSNSIITGIGIKDVKPGKNEFKVTVTTDNGEIGVYTIIVERETVKSANILELRFKEAVINSPHFDKDDTTYQIDVPYEVLDLTIDHIVLEDEENSTYTKTTTPSNFVVGNNIVEIIVTNSISGQEKTYTFNVTRQAFSSNFLKALYTDQGLLSPSFDKYHNNYEIAVPYEVDTIEIIGEKEDAKASERGLGVVPDLKVGVNELSVVVTSESNVPRTYIIRVTRLKDSNADLLSLDVSGGVLSPVFGNSEFNEYTVNVDADSDSVTFSGSVAKTATVEGLDKVKITSPKMSHKITVTAQDGSQKTYKFTIIKQLSKDANVLNIIPSSGQLNPTFSNDLESYSLTVEDEVSKLNFEVLTSNAFAKVSGEKEKRLEYGDNDFTIKVESEDGKNIKEFNIKVTRLKDIQELKFTSNNIVMSLNESKNVELIISPNDATNTDVTWTSSNPEIVSVDEFGNITSKMVGSSEITVHSNKNPNIIAKAVVEVLNLKIESNVLDIVRDGLTETMIKDYVIGLEPAENVIEVLKKFENEDSTLRIYDKEGIELVSDDDIIGTKFIIKLVVNGTVYDELIIIVRGDLDGDSLVTGNDYLLMFNYLLEVNEIDEIEGIAADVDRDELITGNDILNVQNYMLEIIDSLNGLGGN